MARSLPHASASAASRLLKVRAFSNFVVYEFEEPGAATYLPLSLLRMMYFMP